MSNRFEQLLCVHCAPTLAGIKPACVFTCSKQKFPCLLEDLGRCAASLAAFGIRFRVLCECERHLVVMVYRRALLDRWLAGPEQRSFLKAHGYRRGAGVEELLNTLHQRMCCHRGRTALFPHEIGVFLGYPLEDVQGFIEYKGQNPRYLGYWKVYGDVEGAKALFAKYDECRKHYLTLAGRGMGIDEILAA